MSGTWDETGKVIKVRAGLPGGVITRVLTWKTEEKLGVTSLVKIGDIRKDSREDVNVYDFHQFLLDATASFEFFFFFSCGSCGLFAVFLFYGNLGF